MTLEKNAETGVRQVDVFQRFENSEHHFVGVNKMVSAAHSERCVGINAEALKLEAKIAENVVELLEA